jgi:hypothetical protein
MWIHFRTHPRLSTSVDVFVANSSFNIIGDRTEFIPIPTMWVQSFVFDGYLGRMRPRGRKMGSMALFQWIASHTGSLSSLYSASLHSTAFWQFPPQSVRSWNKFTSTFQSLIIHSHVLPRISCYSTPRAESGEGVGDFRGCVHCVHHHDQCRCRWLQTCSDQFKRA